MASTWPARLPRTGDGGRTWTDTGTDLPGTRAVPDITLGSDGRGTGPRCGDPRRDELDAVRAAALRPREPARSTRTALTSDQRFQSCFAARTSLSFSSRVCRRLTGSSVSSITTT